MHRRKHAFPSSSMSDIAFLLLLFFLILAITSHRSPLPIQSPASPTWEELQKEYPTIYVSKEGKLSLGEQILNLETAVFPQELCLLADKDTPFSVIKPILQRLKEAQVTTIHCLVQGTPHA